MALFALAQDWLTTLSLVFGGCCSNAITLEQLTSQYPNAGSLITFFQFIIISLHGLPKHIIWTRYGPRFRPRRIPIIAYLVQVALFYLVSLMNNIAFGFKIPMSVHIIFRSGGLVITMLLGWLLGGKRYNTTQIFSVFVVTIGVVLTTLSASKPSSFDSSSNTLYTYLTGIAILTLALVFSGFLGLAQDWTYSKYGRPLPPGNAKSDSKGSSLPRREDANSTLLGEEKVPYRAIDGGTVNSQQREKLLSNLKVPQSLVLRVGVQVLSFVRPKRLSLIPLQVILIKDLDETLINGSVGRVVRFCDPALYSTENMPVPKEKTGLKSKGSTTKVGTRYPVIDFEVPNGTRKMLVVPEVFKVTLPNGAIQASRTQIPLILASASSPTHKPPGRTSDPLPTWQESLFYLHFLALPMFITVRKDLVSQLHQLHAGPTSTYNVPIPEQFVTSLNSSLHIPPPLAIPFSFIGKNDTSIASFATLHANAVQLKMPSAYLPLLLNTMTQLLCAAGVHRLTTRVSALTVTLTLVIRKAVSLVLSVVFGFGKSGGGSENVDMAMMWTGAALVMLGTVVYSIGTKKPNVGASKPKEKGE
ncbi:golgi uridine diphosphate-N-acetylglucosamine transporter [Paramarasmius palmivorus]|uniref:Golgi uridine diphosphate-N-acetylglucosamine transporter n=1 Tax=Paramarasmius palmivorus TaxID=297713 RepID=A0AAW0DHZ4_9AGAR